MIDLNDDYVAKSFSETDCYEPMFLNCFINSLNIAHKNVLDIGASTGLYSLVAAVHNKKCKVFSFEPFIRAYSRLCNNKELNIFSNINIYPYACSNENSISKFYIKNIEGPITTAGSLRQSKVTEKIELLEIPVRCISIPSIVPLPPIGIIKIDTEGYESIILGSLIEILKKDQPIIFFEALDIKNFTEIFTLLQQIKYNFLYAISERKKTIFKIGTLFKTNEEIRKLATNFIASPINLSDKIV